MIPARFWTSSVSSLPPRTANKLRNLPESERKLYASDLLASYEARGLKLEAVGARMAQGWVERQGQWFALISMELREIILTGDAPEL